MGGITAGRLTSAGSGVNGENIGSSGGSQNHTLIAGEIPTITSVYPGGASFSASGSIAAAINSETSSTPGEGFSFPESPNSTIGISVSEAIPALGGITSNNTGGGAHAIVPPAIVCNYVIRII
jgi:microcystin-dependent protein